MEGGGGGGGGEASPSLIQAETTPGLTTAADLLLSSLDLEDVCLVAHSAAGGEVIRYLTNHGDERVERLASTSASDSGLDATAQNRRSSQSGILGSDLKAGVRDSTATSVRRVHLA